MASLQHTQLERLCFFTFCRGILILMEAKNNRIVDWSLLETGIAGQNYSTTAVQYCTIVVVQVVYSLELYDHKIMSSRWCHSG